MNIRTLPFHALTPGEIATWSEIQRANPELASPFFRPEFTKAVASVRRDVEIAVIEDDSKAIGFFPFQRSARNIGIPVGGRLSDFHGVIAPANFTCDPRELMRACGLKAWRFDHLLAGQNFFGPHVWYRAESPYVDVRGGLDGYFARRDNAKSLRGDHRTKTRQLARKYGPVRFETGTQNRAAFSKLLEWKSAQYRRSVIPDILQMDWIRDLFEIILQCDTEHFAGHLSVLYAGDRIAAVHFGMRSGAVLHHWFPAYDVDMSRSSPGYVHAIELFQAAASTGIEHIDFGKGEENYKRRIMTGASYVAEGSVDVRPGAAFLERTWWTTRERIRTSSLAQPARMPVKLARLARHWAECAMVNRSRRA